MGFDIYVGFDKLPESFNDDWRAAFARHGFDLEFPPGVDVKHWTQGNMPFRVHRAPEELIGFVLPGDALAKVEIFFRDKIAHFRTAAERSTTEFAIQCVGAALVASLTKGMYADEQNGVIANGDEALLAAKSEV